MILSGVRGHDDPYKTRGTGANKSSQSLQQQVVRYFSPVGYLLPTRWLIVADYRRTMVVCRPVTDDPFAPGCRAKRPGTPDASLSSFLRELTRRQSAKEPDALTRI